MDKHRLKELALKATALFLVAAVWPTAATGAPVQLDVEIAGCALLTERDGCTLHDSRTLDLWVAHTLNEPVQLRAQDRLLSTDQILHSNRVQGGSHFKLSIPDGANSLSVVVGAAQWRLGLSKNSWPDVLIAARDLNRRGDLEQGVNLIESSLPGISAQWHGTALRLLGQGQRRLGNSGSAKASLAQSIEADLQAGRSSSAARTMTVLVFMLMKEGDFSQARILLQQEMSIPASDADSRYNLSYFRGLFAYNTSNARLTIDHLSEASRQAQRMGRATQQVYAETLLAVQLQRIGRTADADRYMSRWMGNLPEDFPACEEANLLTNVGWTRLLLLESGEAVDNPVAVLQRADQLAEQHCTSGVRGNTLANLALAQLHAGNVDEAERLVGEVLAIDTLSVRTMLWLLEIEARIELARGQVEAALHKYDRLEELSLATVSVSARWRALVGKARSYTVAGNTEDALAAYFKAEWLLTEYLPSIPIDQGREALLNARSLATREHVGLLLNAGRDAEAFTLAREARVRLLRSITLTDRVEYLSPESRVRWERALGDYRNLRVELDETARDAWMLPADELNELKRSNQQKERELRAIIDRAALAIGAPDTPDSKSPNNGNSIFADPMQGGLARNDSDRNARTGVNLDEVGLNSRHTGHQPLMVPKLNELMVLMSSTPHGWAVFAHDGQRLSVFQPRCKQTAADELAACLIGTVVDKASRVDAIRVLPTGVLTGVDFHAIAIDGVPLIQKAPVLYALDLATTSSEISHRGAALLVADAGGDLAAARKELNSVSATLNAAKGWRQQLLRDSEATATAVRAALPQSQLFHFAGHARFAGEFGWDSQIMLSGDTALGITDIITLADVPSLVVLSGCETARTHASSFAQSMGLASAFLVAGSNSVLATSRPVRDSTAAQLMTEFYRHWTSGSPPRVALRNAQLNLMETQPQSDWAAYRLTER